MLRDSTVIVVRMRPRAMPLAMITMRKSTHGFPFLPLQVWGSAWRPFGLSELRYKITGESLREKVQASTG